MGALCSLSVVAIELLHRIAPWNRAASFGEKRDGACTPFCPIMKTWRRAVLALC